MDLHRVNRRVVLAAVVASALAMWPLCGYAAAEPRQKTVRFGVCADVHKDIMHDADQKGDEGAKETLWRMHEVGIDAYLVWSRKMHGGRFADRQPESLSDDEWISVVAGTRNEA